MPKAQDITKLMQSLGSDFSSKQEALNSLYKGGMMSNLKMLNSLSILKGISLGSSSLTNAFESMTSKATEEQDKLTEAIKNNIFESISKKSEGQFEGTIFEQGNLLKNLPLNDLQATNEILTNQNLKLPEVFKLTNKKELIDLATKKINDGTIGKIKDNDIQKLITAIAPKGLSKDVSSVQQAFSKTPTNPQQLLQALGSPPTMNGIQDLMDNAVNGLNSLNSMFKNLKLTVSTVYDEVSDLGKMDRSIFDRYKEQLNTKLSGKEQIGSTIMKLAYNKFDELTAYKDFKYEKIITDALGTGIAQLTDPSMLMNPSELKNVAMNATENIQDKAKEMAINKAKEIVNKGLKDGLDMESLKELVQDPVGQLSSAASELKDAAMGMPGYLLSTGEQLLVQIRENVENEVMAQVEQLDSLYMQAKALQSQMSELADAGVALGDTLTGGLVSTSKNKMEEWAESNGII